MRFTANLSQKIMAGGSPLLELIQDPSFASRLKAISIRLIHSRNPKNIDTLKKFLTVAPDPGFVEETLTAAISEISTTSVKTTYWLLQNAELFQPEIDVREIINRRLSQTLATYGFLENQHYQFDLEGNLTINKVDREKLWAEIPYSSHSVAFIIICSLLEKAP